MRKLLFSALLLSLSCDGSSKKIGDLASCGNFSPCGGSLVGSWKVNKLCADARTTTTDGCTETVDILEYDAEVSFVFSADNTYSSKGTLNAKADIGFSKDCFSAVKTATCDELFSSISEAGIRMSCSSGSAGDCRCSETISNKAAAEEGTYTISGNTVTTRATGSTRLLPPSEYCVQGNTLMLRELGDSNGSGDGSSIMLLTRQ
jgi:hypothetical protein